MIIIPMLLTRELRPKEGVRAWQCSLCRCPVFPSLGPPGPYLSSYLSPHLTSFFLYLCLCLLSLSLFPSISASLLP